MNRIAAATLVLTVLGSGAVFLSGTAEAKTIRVTGLVAGGSKICSTSGCQRTPEGQDLSVFVMRSSGDVARVRHRGETFSVDADKVSVRLSQCVVNLKAYAAGARCTPKR